MRTYAVHGFSMRSIAQFVLPFTGNPKLPEYGDFRSHGKVVAVLDVDRGRVEEFNRRQGTAFPCYGPGELDRMIEETRPDVVAIGGPDFTHAEAMIGALRHGCDVICEKPMVISIAQAQAVLAAERQSKGGVRVAHNYRYPPPHKAVKRMIQSGMLGRITNVEFVYNIDTRHGASYFQRWNRDRSQSGGLTIHKCCHHFDLINWWLNDTPQQVFAYGALNYFGPRSPFKPAGAASLEEVKARCPYWKRWRADQPATPPDEHLAAHDAAFKLPYTVQYAAAKPLYIYDEDIAIEDTYSAVVRYTGGASMTYSCNFSAAWEGYTVAINGTGGRLETTSQPSAWSGLAAEGEGQPIVYYPLFGERQIHTTRPVAGGHGGADEVLKGDMFIGESAESRELAIFAGTRAGAYAVAMGELVWRSIQENRPLDVPVF
jgi:predicted dehydrogenase